MRKIYNEMIQGRGGKKLKIDAKKLLLNIAFIDIIFLCVVTILCSFLFSKFTYPMLSGIIIAYMNFLQGTIVNYKLLQGIKKNNRFKNFTEFSCRVIVAALIPIALFGYNINAIMAYVTGYVLHLISITIYGINSMRFEGK